MDIGSLTGQIAIEDQLTDKLTEITSQVWKFAEEFDGAMGTLAIGVGIAAAAITGMAISIVELGDKGSNINDVTSTLEHFSGSAEHATEILDKMRAGLQGTVSDFDLAKDASRLLSAGVKLNADQFGELTQAAFVLQNRGLGSTKDMMDLVSSALITGRTRALAMKLGVVEVKDSTEEFAKSLGVEVSQLSAAGQAEGKRIGIMKMLEAANKDAGDQQRDFGEQLEFARAKITNWTNDLASAVAESPQVMLAVTTIGNALSKAFGDSQKTLMDNIIAGINAFSQGVADAVPYIVDFAHGVKDAWDFTAQFWPVIKLAAEAFIVYEGILILSSAATWLFQGAVIAANLVGVIYNATIAMMAGETATFGASLTTALGPIGLITIAVTAMIEGWKAAQKESGWVRELSDSFEYASLRVQGYTAAEADAMIATDHATQKAKEHAASLTAQQRAAENLNSVWGTGIEVENKAADAGDRHKFITDKQSEAQKKYSDALIDYNSHTGGDFLKVMDKIGATMYEGIAFDHARGISTETLAEVYKTTKGVIETVITSEKNWAQLKKETAAVHKLETENLTGLITGMAAVDEREIKFIKTQLALADAMKMVEKSLPPVVAGFNSVVVNLENVGMHSDEIDKIKVGMQVADEATKKFDKTLKGQLLLTLESVPQTIANALTGGGGFLGAAKAIGSQIGSVIGKNIGEDIGKSFGSITSGLGKLAGPIGAAVGSLVGPLIDALANIGGPSKAELAGRKLEQSFEAAAGGFQGMMDAVGKAYEATGHSSTEAQADVKALLDAEKEGPEATQKWIDKIQGIEKAAAGLGTLATGLSDELGAALKVPSDALASYDALNQKQMDLRTQIDSSSGAQQDALKTQLVDVMKQLNDAGNLYNATIPRTQAQADALASAVVGDFASMIKNGVDFTTAVGKIGPSVTELTSIFNGMGDVVTDTTKLGGAGFEELKGFVDLASDAVAGPAIDSVQHLGMAMGDLEQLGLGNKETFEGLGDQIGNTFDSLIKQGKDGNALMIAMRDPIQKLWEEQQKYGLVLDDSTQKMVDQAVQQGIVGPEMEDINKQLLKVMKDIDDTLKSMSGHANDFTNSVNNIPSKKTTEIVTVHTDVYNSETDSGAAAAAAQGGRVTPSGISYYGNGTDNVLRSPFVPRGTDTVPAMLTPGEEVSSVHDVGSQAQSMDSLSRDMAAIRQLLAGQPASMAVALKDAIVLLPRRIA